jgi:hypothetical protein
MLVKVIKNAAVLASAIMLVISQIINGFMKKIEIKDTIKPTENENAAVTKKVKDNVYLKELFSM